MEQIVRNKKYYVKQLNSSKANKMTELYHYSGVGFKKSKLNLGVYRNEDRKLVGVMQWGCSFQEGIRLERYVKEPITIDEYLELNRFSMADSEGKNSESQAISLGIKWIKTFRKDIRLLVSYAGRKEGNYGYIYQATNWEYLGYFISKGFWFLDGEERHLLTLWARFSNRKTNVELGFTDWLCAEYSDVRETKTKQFIYITRLDKKLTPTTPMEYPKPSNEFPIKVDEKIWIQNDEVFNSYVKQERTHVEYYDEGEEPLFSRAVLIKRGEIVPRSRRKVAMYDIGGNFLQYFNSIDEAVTEEYNKQGISMSINSGKKYKGRYFRYYNGNEEAIEVPIICKIDGIAFGVASDIARYTSVSKQAVSAARKRKQSSIGGRDVEWCE